MSIKISIPRNALDNDYTINEDGAVIRFYDRNSFDLNNTDHLHVRDIQNHVRDQLIEKCPEHLKDKLSKIFEQFPSKH